MVGWGEGIDSVCIPSVKGERDVMTMVMVMKDNLGPVVAMSVMIYYARQFFLGVL